jgi:PmbA protein
VKSEEICSLVLHECKAEGATDTVVTVMELEEVMIRFSNNQITVTKNLNKITANIFAFVKEKKAGTDLADLSKRSLRSTSRRLVSEAKSSPPGEIYAPLPEGPFTYSKALLNQPQIDLTPDTIVGYVETAVDAGLEEGARRMAGSLIARNIRMTIQTSGEAFGVASKSSIELSLRAFGDGQASGHSVSISGSEKEFDAKEAGREAGMLSRLSASPEDGVPGEFDAVLGPLVFADLINQVGRGSSAFYVDAGLSFLAEKVGEEVSSRILSVYDDGTKAGTYGSFPFDLEGLPVKKTPIIEKGELKGYLHNSTTAKKMGVETTANAGLINPQPFNLVVEQGRRTVEDLISKVDSGVYVTNDWYLRYQNWTNGDFSMIPRDAMFVIKDGELSSSIRELRISDNIPRMLQSVDELSRERRWVKWWEVDTPTLTPTALIKETKFTKSTM